MKTPSLQGSDAVTPITGPYSTPIHRPWLASRRVKRDRAEIARRLQRLNDQRRLDLLRQLQVAEMALSEVRSKAATRSVPWLSLRQTTISGFPPGPTEDTELSPGDVVEVALHLDYQTSALLQERP